MKELDCRIPEILTRTDLDGLVSRLGGLEVRRSASRVLYHCPHPSHDDHNPSFDTYEPPGGGSRRWACRSQCGAGGDAIDLLVWLRGLTTAEAIDELAREGGLERDRRRLDPVGEGKRRAQITAERDLLVRWCASRGWGPWVVEELGLSLVEDQFGRRRVRFPFRLTGHGVPYHQDRALDPAEGVKWLSPKGGRAILYEADRLRLARERGAVLIVEGVSDVAALVDVYAGPAVVGVPGVNAWRPKWAQLFSGLIVYVLADNDEAGEKLRRRLSDEVEPVARELHQVRVPEPYNDIADWRAGLDPGEFHRQLFDAIEQSTGSRTLREAG